MSRRNTKPKALVFYGYGESSYNNTKGLLDDFLGFSDGVPEDDATYIAISAPVYGDVSAGISSVFEWADEHELLYDVSIEESEGDQNNVCDYADDTFDEVEIWEKLRSIQDTHYINVIVLWDDKRRTEDFVGKSASLGYTVLDLTEALQPIEVVVTEEEEPDIQTPEPAEKVHMLEATVAPLEDTSPPWEVGTTEIEYPWAPLVSEHEVYAAIDELAKSVSEQIARLKSYWAPYNGPVDAAPEPPVEPVEPPRRRGRPRAAS